jgi:hypothetical protein
MLLLSQGCCFIQSLLFSYVLREESVKFSRIYFGSLAAVRTTWNFVRTLIIQQHPSKRRELFFRTPISVWKLQTVQDSIHPDVMVNRPDALQSSRRSQCFSASVRTTWLYCPDAIQCLTSIRVSASRHIYGKTAATVRTMCNPVWTIFSIRQDVHTKFNRPDDNLHGPNDQASYMEIACTSSTVRTSPLWSGRSKALLW